MIKYLRIKTLLFHPSVQESKLVTRVFNDYDSRIRPDSDDLSGENGTQVSVNVYLRLIADINTKAMVGFLFGNI